MFAAFSTALFQFLLLLGVFVVADGVFKVCKAISSLENCIRETVEQFASKSEAERTLDFMREVGFGEPKD
jgi:hypothetical protein